MYNWTWVHGFAGHTKKHVHADLNTADRTPFHRMLAGAEYRIDDGSG
jgi:hypothetical protein